MEEQCLGDWRRELLSPISGDILEIGSGTGVNLFHYPKSIGSLTLTEPEPHMRKLLQNNVNNQPEGKIRVEAFSAEALKFPDQSFDAVVSTLVLCSVNSPEKTLEEIKRVLKPQGKLFVLEHVLATEKTPLIKWQKLLQPFWKCMCGNCHLTRNTEKSILEAGFSFDSIDRVYSSGGPAVISTMIKGVALL